MTRSDLTRSDLTRSDQENAALRRTPQGRSSFALRVALFYSALFITYGVVVPYLPVWLHSRGLTPAEVATVTAAPFFVRLFATPAVAVLADYRRSHREIVIGLAVSGLVLALALSLMQGFWPIFLLAVPFALAVSSIMPLTETIAMTGVRDAGLDYGRMRLWGSLSFIVMGFAAGSLIDVAGAGSAIWLIVAGAAATAVAAPFLPRAPAGTEKTARGRFASTEAWALVRSRPFLLFLVAAGAVQGAHATFYTFGALHWRSQGISGAWVGTLWAIAVLAEVAVFAYSGALNARLGPMKLLLAGAVAALLRWTIMCFDPPLWLLVPLQALHGLTYGASHLGAMHFIAGAVPTSAAGTAQALYATMAAGIVMGAATLAAGPLYAAYAGLAYAGPALLSAVGVAAALALARSWRGGALDGPPAMAGSRDR